MEVADFLKKISLFANLTDRNLKRLARACTERSFNPGDYLVRQDDEGVGLFVIISGLVKVIKSTAGGNVIEIATHGPGEFVGEFSVLDGAKRTASVVAEEKTSCVVLAAWDFNSIVQAHPEIALDILPVVVRRFRETNEKLLSMTEGNAGS